MPRSRRPTFGYLLIVVLGLVMTALGAAGRAGAATADTITAVSATSPASDLGDLSVTIDSTTQLSAVAVHLHYQDPTGQDMLDPAMTLGTPTATTTGFETVATVATPIGLADLPLGMYTVSVDATDAGTSVTGQSAGTLLFVDAPHVTLIVTPTSVSYGNTTVTASGSVTLTRPDGTQAAYSYRPVTLSGGTGMDQPLYTAADGTFTGLLTMPSGGTATAHIDATEKMLLGTASASVGRIVDAIQFSNTRLSHPTVNYAVAYSATDTLTGTLKYLPGNTGTVYQPLPGQTVKVYSSLSPGSLAAIGTTDGNGNFSITLPIASRVTSTWTVKAGSLIGDAQFGAAQASVKMTVQAPTRVSSFTMYLNQYWQLSYSGCLNLTTSIPGPNITGTAGLVLQYSAGGPNGPWKNMLWKPPVTRACGHGGVWFSGSTVAPMNYAYYRMHYTGMTYAGISYPAANSASVLAWKYADRITSFSVSPTTVASSGKITVKGQLQYYSNYKWHNYGGQVVEIIFRQANTSTWYWIVKVRTDSAGRFSAAVPVAGIGSATWSAQFNGNSTHLAAAPGGVYVRVTG